MQDLSYYPLGQLNGTEVGVEPTLSGQNILVQYADLGQRLASLLVPGSTEIVRLGDVLYWRVPHDQHVDRLLVELTDLFISIRYAHPAMVQLELALSESEGVVLEPDEP
jgi:hypothetical protein